MSTVYNVTVQGAGLAPQNITVSGKPLHFGSGENVDLVLADKNIPEIAGRLFLSSGNKILLFNLGTHFTLDGAPVPQLQPTIWKPGARLQIGTYTLDLKTIDVLLPKTVADETPVEAAPLSEGGQSTRPPLAADSRVPDVLPEVSTFIDQPAPKTIVSKLATDEFEEDIETVKEKVGFKGLDDSKVKDPDETDWRGYSRDENRTEVAPPIIENDLPEDRDGFTRVKNWVEQDKLSVQLGLKSINFAPGERVMLPLSVRNNYSHPLELLVSVVGLPADWTIADSPIISLAAGEMKAFEVIILTRMTAVNNRLDAFLNLIDRITPEINVHVPLPIILKSQADLTGYFDQPRTKVPGNLYLTLQNQTLSSEKVRLSIGNHDNALRVLLSNSEMELAPYQKIRIPVKVEVVKAPYFVGRNYTLHISAQQGTRAPLDLVTVVSAAPSLFRYLLLVIVALLVGLLLVITRLGGAFSALAAATPTLTLTLTPIPATLPIPTAVDIPTSIPPVVVPPTDIPPTDVLIPTNTPLPFADPRSEDCQANGPIPSGWVLYMIKNGETLYRIAARHKTGTGELARVNCIQDITRIYAGQTIVVPPGS